MRFGLIGNFVANLRSSVFLSSVTSSATRVRRNWLWFMPALAFFALGAAVLLMPALILGLLAGFLVLLGIGFGFVAMKLIRLRARLEEVASQLKGSGGTPAVIQGTVIFGGNSQMHSGFGGSRIDRQTEFVEVESINDKSKIVIH